jgi:TldD protein
VKKGIFAKSFGGGQVDIVSGKFVFSCTEAYRIENGKLGAPDQGRDADRRRPDGADQGDRHRQRLRARRGCRHVRQGRAERAGRRRAADLLVEGLTVGGTAA